MAKKSPVPKKRILFVTGGSGFIGRHVLRELAQGKFFSSIILATRDKARLKLLLSREGLITRDSVFEIVEGREGYWGIPREKVTHVLHMAGIRTGRSFEEFHRVHVQGTRQLLSELSGRERIVILSSHSALGAGSGPQLRGDFDSEFPIGWEGQSKLDMERMIQSEFGKRNCLILRPSMVVGQGDALNESLRVLGSWPFMIKLGAEAKSYSFVASDDLARAIVLAISDERDWRTWDRKVFHIASDETVSDTDILSMPRALKGKGGFVVGVPQSAVRSLTRIVERSPFLRRRFPLLVPNRFREIAPHWWLVNGTRFSETFQWFPKVDFRDAMKAALQ